MCYHLKTKNKIKKNNNKKEIIPNLIDPHGDICSFSSRKLVLTPRSTMNF